MNRPLLIPLAMLLAVAALAVAGCGGNDDEGSSSTTTSGAAAPKPQGAAGKPTVSMKDIQFIPQTITAKVGQKITWTNDDSVAHTVTKNKDFKGSGPESDTVEPGATYTFTPKKAGTIPYFCEIHPNQTGSITVTK